MKKATVLKVLAVGWTLSSLGYGSEGESFELSTMLADDQSVVCDLDCYRSGQGVEKVQGYGSNVSEALKAATELCIEIGGMSLGRADCKPVSR